MSYLLAIDVGGTSMKGGLVHEQDILTAATSRPTTTHPAGPVAAVRDLTAELALAGQAYFGHPPHALALAVPGVVEDNVARYSATLGWRDVPAEAFSALDHVPVVLSNDVLAAGLAEAAFTPEQDFLFLAIGTSIAGALFLDGKPYGTSLTGQLGHSPVYPGGRLCPCGQRGCLAAYASASAIATEYGAPHAAAVAEALVAGSERAERVWRTAVDALALSLAGYTLTLNPQAVIVGGGLALSGELLLEPLRGALAQRLSFHTSPEVRTGRLGQNAGVLGAARLARRASPR
ncbi:ROK family protein [Streptomyces microflavus]|uniref:ROK family protein n=1 Tax=Streptomyces microflavus TaxID=1919 RepID=UPI003655E19A